MITIDVGSMVKIAREQERKRKELSNSEALAIALAPIPVQILGGALAAGGGAADKPLIKELLRLGQRQGIEFRDYPKESILRKIWRLSRGDFRTGAGVSEPMIEKITPEQAKTPYPGPVPGLTWGDVVGKKIIWKPSSPGMLAHEIGHMRERIPKALQIAEMIGQPAGVGVGALGALLAKSPREAERLGQIGAAIAAGIALPSLYREIAASARGLSLMRQAGATRGQLIGQGLSKMAPAFLASVAKASLAPITSILLSKLIARSKERKEAAR